MVYFIYNPMSNANTSIEIKDKTINDIKEKFNEFEEIDGTKIDIVKFCKELKDDDILIISGGDGTVNLFANIFKDNNIKNEIYLAGNAGTGNDFLNDIGPDQKMVQLNKYFENLPKVYANGQEKYFINNVGFGIDGMVCIVAEDQKKKGKKKINYTSITIGLLLGKYKRRNATVKVDGKEIYYKNVWLVSSMNGRYYGGGMNSAPSQDRFGDKVSLVVMHEGLRIPTLIRFTKIFKGTHIKYKKYVEIIEGKNIEVTFDKPCGLQYDGEIIDNVTTYKVEK